MSNFVRALGRAILVAGCAIPALAHAEHTPVLDSVIVTATPDPEDPPVVARARQRLSETPGAVAVVSAESYERRLAAGLNDVLRDAPGVYAQKKWGGDIRLSIRGSGLGNNSHNRGTLIAQDGVPFNEADGFGDFQLIDPLIARYTEVYKGGNALRFGGALLGGAVNLVTPTGRTADADNRLRLDGGSFGTLRGHGELARTSGDWDVFAAATAMTAEGWREHSNGNGGWGSLNIGRSFGQDREVRLILSGGNIEQEIPGALTLAQVTADPRMAASNSVGGDHKRNMRSARTAVQTNWRLSETTVFEGGFYAIWKDLDHPISIVVDQESRNVGAFGRLDWEGRVGGLKVDAYSGLWLRAGDLDARTWQNFAGERGALTAASRQNARAADLFAEGRLFVTDRFALIGGGALGWTDRDFAAALGAPRAHSTDFEWFAPRVGLLWEGETGAQVFANITRSVEPPNFSALVQGSVTSSFVPLKPQEAWTAEAGARGRQGVLTWDVTLYRAELEHELLSFNIGPDVPAATFNAPGPTIHQGIEAGLDWRLTDHWRLRQTYGWSDFRFDRDPLYGDNELPIVPEHLYRAELRYEHPAGWFAAPSLEWSPRGPWVDFTNTTRAEGYAIWSLNAGWSSREGVSLFLDARNLADERYVSNVNAVVRANAASAVYWPGEGRSLYAGVSYDF